jgi:hypothetical protein
MKVMSAISVVVGVLALLGGVGVMIWGGWIAYWHYATLSTGRSAEFQNPIPIIIGAAALLVLGGFLAGLGIGRPRRQTAPVAVQVVPPTEPTV